MILENLTQIQGDKIFKLANMANPIFEEVDIKEIKCASWVLT